jgi:hypothetical protein
MRQLGIEDRFTSEDRGYQLHLFGAPPPMTEARREYRPPAVMLPLDVALAADGAVRLAVTGGGGTAPVVAVPVYEKEVTADSTAGQDMLAEIRAVTGDFNTWIETPEGKAALAAKRAARMAVRGAPGVAPPGREYTPWIEKPEGGIVRYLRRKSD